MCCPEEVSSVLLATITTAGAALGLAYVAPRANHSGRRRSTGISADREHPRLAHRPATVDEKDQQWLEVFGENLAPASCCRRLVGQRHSALTMTWGQRHQGHGREDSQLAMTVWLYSRPRRVIDTTWRGGGFDHELAEALWVCNHVDRDDLSAGDRERDDGDETPARCH